ncbi:MAG: DUF4249 domain-containing protein [Prolixibacteraceae bacterium]|nr:DUF4249 domain-containing protein [Prolixibacteraceae bacterium]
MNIKLFFSCIIVGFILISCEKDIEFKEEITNPLVAVNSFVTPDSTITAYISMSSFFLKDTVAYRNVNNAEVNLWINGTLKEKLNFDSVGIYKSSYKPAISDQIKLTVDVPQMKQVSATTNFTHAPVILSIDTLKVITKKEVLWTLSGDTQVVKQHYKVNYKLKFTDNGNQENYYRLIVRKVSFEGVWNEQTNKVDTIANERLGQYSDFDFTDVVSGNTTDPLADEGTSPVSMLLSNTTNRYHVFSDDLFNGKTYSLQFSTNITKYIKDIHYGSLENIKHEVYISLQNISEDYYLYLKTRGASYAANYFSEPVKVHNNITNGIGILGSYTNSNIVRINLD